MINLYREAKGNKVLFAILTNFFFACIFSIGLNVNGPDVWANDSELQWQIVTVDSIGLVGKYSSIALNNSAYARISYFDQTNCSLKYASQAGASWHPETVDSTGLGCYKVTVGLFPSLALDSNDSPRIVYGTSAWEGYTSYQLDYAVWNGTSWDIEFVTANSNSSFVLDSNDNPIICYEASIWDGPDTIIATDLKCGSKNGVNWNFVTVDTGGYVGSSSSLAIDSNNNPMVCYYDATNGDLKYAKYNGASWQIEVVDNVGDVGLYTSLVLGSNGFPKISYYDATNGDLKYAQWNGVSWQREIVDKVGDVGMYTSLALDSNDYPRISYYDATNGNLKYAQWDGIGWQRETVDKVGDVGMYTSLALDSNGFPRISYYDATNGDLKYAQKKPYQFNWSIFLPAIINNVVKIWQ